MRKLILIAFLFLLINSAYVWAFAFPTVFYMGNVLLHVGLGLVAAAGLAWLVQKDRGFARRNLLAVGLLSAGALAGFYLVRFGATTGNRWVLYGHVAFALTGSVALAPYLW